MARSFRRWRIFYVPPSRRSRDMHWGEGWSSRWPATCALPRRPRRWVCRATLGIYPAAGGTWRLPRLVGIGRAKDLVFTGRILESAEAFSLGIFERLCEPGEAVATAMELAATIAQNAPLALQVAKLSLSLFARGGDPTPLERAGQGWRFESADKRGRSSVFLS